MIEPKGKPSRPVVGFNRLGIVLGTPFLLIAAVLAFLQWQNPTGRTAIPVGAIASPVGDDADEAAKQLMAKQQAAGFDLPGGLILIGIPRGMVGKDGVDWTKFELPDGRKIVIASTEAKKARRIAEAFLLAEQAAGRGFGKEDQIEIDGVRVAFLNASDSLPAAPWLGKERDWGWPLLSLSLGVAFYIAMCALGWVIEGFGLT